MTRSLIPIRLSTVFALFTLLALGCIGVFRLPLAGRNTPETAPSPKTTNESAPSYHDLYTEQGDLNPLILHPFPFRIEVRWAFLHEGEPVRWKIKVVNEDDRPHKLAAVEILGYMAALDFQPVSPSAQVETIRREDGSLRKRLYYELTLQPGEEVTLDVDVTAYLGIDARGVLLFCAEIPALGSCMVLPMTAYVTK